MFVRADTDLSNLFSLDDGSPPLVNDFYTLVDQMLCVTSAGERVHLCIVFEVHDISDCPITTVVYGVFYRTSVWMGTEYSVLNRFSY